MVEVDGFEVLLRATISEISLIAEEAKRGRREDRRHTGRTGEHLPISLYRAGKLQGYGGEGRVVRAGRHPHGRADSLCGDRRPYFARDTLLQGLPQESCTR